MKLKEIENLISVLSRFHYDENRNMRPEVSNALIDLERERLLRMKQRKDWRDNITESAFLRYGR